MDGLLIRRLFAGMANFVADIAVAVAGIAVAITRKIIGWLRPLLVTVIAIAVTGIAVAVTLNYLYIRIQAQIENSFVCDIPLVASYFPCKATLPPPPNYELIVNKQLDTYEQLMEQQFQNDRHGESITQSLTISRLAIKDLSVEVKHSDLTNAIALSSLIEKFAYKLGELVIALQKMEAKITGTFENLVFSNEIALNQLKYYKDIQDFKMKQTQSEIDDKVNTFQSTYLSTMSISVKSLKNIVVAATDASGIIDELEEMLTGIHDLMHGEMKFHTDAQKNKSFFVRLWELVGGNKVALQKYEENLRLLTNFEELRKRTVGKLAATKMTVNEFQFDLETFVTHINDAISENHGLSIEMQIQKVEMATNKLKSLDKSIKKNLGNQITSGKNKSGK